MREALTSQALVAPKFRYSQVIKTGPHYHCSGLVALDKATGNLVEGGPGLQTRKILDNLGLLLEELGLDWRHVVYARIYTTEFEKFSEINAAWEEVFDEGKVPPARSAMGVTALPLGANVEIEFSLYQDA